MLLHLNSPQQVLHTWALCQSNNTLYNAFTVGRSRSNILLCSMFLDIFFVILYISCFVLFCLHVDNGEFEDKSIDKTVVAQCTDDSSLGLSKSLHSMYIYIIYV